MTIQVVTWQSPTGAQMTVCTKCEATATTWPKDHTGQEYCTVSKGRHHGECDVCDHSWDRDYECPRCGETLTPESVELKSWGRSCPKCGLDEHPVFDALDRLCEE